MKYCSACGKEKKKGIEYDIESERAIAPTSESLMDKIKRVPNMNLFFCSDCVKKLAVIQESYNNETISALLKSAIEKNLRYDKLKAKLTEKETERKQLEENLIDISKLEVANVKLCMEAKDAKEKLEYAHKGLRGQTKITIDALKLRNEAMKAYAEREKHILDVLQENINTKKATEHLVTQVARLMSMCERQEQDLKHYDKLYKFDRNLKKVKKELKKVVDMDGKEWKITDDKENAV